MPAAAVTRDNTFYTTLRSEIETDPTALGYAPFRTAGADGAIAQLLNTIIVGNTINDGVITKDEFYRVFVGTGDFAVLSAQDQTLLGIYALQAIVDYNDPTVKANLNRMFPTTGAGTTRNKLALKATRDGSRAEKLWGVGTTISSDDVSIARTLFAPGTPGW